MTYYPVHYAVEPPERFSRLQLALRVLAFLVIGAVGLSFGTVFLVIYLGLPVLAAVRIAARSDPAAYVREDGPRVLRGLRWLAAVSAWAGMIAERLPVHAPDETVTLTVEGEAHPTASAAAWRVVTGLPSALVLALLCWVGVFVWLWAVLSVLFAERVGHVAFDFLVGLQRWTVRLFAYQASLVDAYPPFSLGEGPPVELSPQSS